MSTKFQAASMVDGDPEFEYLINLSGDLIPIAHIKLIGSVVHDLAEVIDENGHRDSAYGFIVMLTDSDSFSGPAENTQQLYDTWPTRKEAEEQRRNLAIQVDEYYKKLLGKK